MYLMLLIVDCCLRTTIYDKKFQPQNLLWFASLRIWTQHCVYTHLYSSMSDCDSLTSDTSGGGDVCENGYYCRHALQLDWHLLQFRHGLTLQNFMSYTYLTITNQKHTTYNK